MNLLPRRRTAGRKHTRIARIAMLIVALPLSAAAGPFVLDFQPDDINGINASDERQQRCNFPGFSDINCSWKINQYGEPNKTWTYPYLNEFVADPDGTGYSYYHQIIGDPLDGFVMDVYILKGGKKWQGGFGTSSAGTITGDVLNSNSGWTGNGTANVKRVVMRQAMGDLDANGDCAADAVGCFQFTKNELNYKPKIEQRYNVPDEMSLLFVNDMSNKTFSDKTAIDPANNTNTFTLLGPEAPVAPLIGAAGPVGGDGDFDVHADSQNSRITAGAYTWTSGSGPGGSLGTWTYYANGPDAPPTTGFDPTNEIDWKSFYDPAQNTDLWSFPAYQP